MTDKDKAMVMVVRVREGQPKPIHPHRIIKCFNCGHDVILSDSTPQDLEAWCMECTMPEITKDTKMIVKKETLEEVALLLHDSKVRH